ncbi:hypothetical protein ACHQM5_027941 [Ranunculus cassubicifolius]
MAYIVCLCLGFLLLTQFSLTESKISSKIGINYGQLGNNLPSPSQSIQLIKNLKAKRVKLYNADPQLLKLLSNTNLEVSIMISNQEISNISSNQTLANQWVRTNILPFYPQTKIRFLLVGNEVLSFYSDQDKQTWSNLVPAMTRIKRSLKNHNITKIKVSTPHAMDILQSTFPPSNGTFRNDISQTVMKPMLSFLNRTKSFFFLDVYPYFPWSENPTQINLDYALMKQSTNVTYTDPNSHFTYTNLLDQMLDSVSFAMEKLGYRKIPLIISETGWPTSGDIDQIGANIYNAATYNRNLVRKVTSRPPVGTPARPGSVIPTFIFSLYNENRKTGPGTERNWGLLHPNGSRVYDVDLTGEQEEADYDPLPTATNNLPYRGKIWCVVADNSVNDSALGDAVAYACSQGNETCSMIQPGRRCYEPVSLVSHASYAFSSYWNQFRSSGATCSFGGLAVQSTKDPSHGSCKYPSVTL